MNRSVGVTVIAIVVLIGSALMLGMGALTLVGALAGTAAPAPRDFPGSTVFFKAILLMVPLIYILPAVWGIVTGIGLLQLKNWARISIIVFSILLLFFGLFTGLGSSVFFLTNPPPTLDRQVVAFVRVFMLAFAAVQIGLGVWWLVFFNRAKVKQQFLARPMFGGYPLAQGGYPIQPSYHVQPPPSTAAAAVAQLPQIPQGRRRPLSITIIAWFMLAGCLFLPVNLALHTPASLFVWVLTGWQADAFFLAVVALLVYVAVGLLRLDPYARLAGISYFAFAVVNSAVFFFAPGARTRMTRILELQHSMLPWLRDWQGAYPQPDPMPLMLMGAVIGLVFCLVPLYFLVREKQAFEKPR